MTQRGVGIVSAISSDGMAFELEPGPRFPGDVSTFAPDLVVLPDGRYRIYFVANVSDRPTMQGGGQHLMTALSDDGLTWERAAEPVLSPGGTWDRAKSSELCVFPLPAGAGETAGYGMVYEGCDGTTPNARGVWRVVAATSADSVSASEGEHNRAW